MAIRHATTEMCISIDSRPEHLPRLRTIVGCLADSLGMNSEETQDAKLVVTEACANAIRHGSPDGVDSGVIVKLMTDSRAMVVEVSDHGHGFNVDEISDPQPAQKSGGLGIPLMKALTDQVEFLRNGKGMTVRMVKKLKSNMERRRRTVEEIETIEGLV